MDKERCCLLDTTSHYYKLVRSSKELAAAIDGALHIAGFALRAAKMDWPKNPMDAFEKHQSFKREANERHGEYKQHEHELDPEVALNTKLNITETRARANVYLAIGNLLNLRETLLGPDNQEWALPCDAPDEASESVANTLCYWSTYWLTTLGVNIRGI